MHKQEGWGYISPTVYIAVSRGAEAGGMGVYIPNSIYSRVQGCRSRRDGGIYPPTVYIAVFRGAEAGGMGVYKYISPTVYIAVFRGAETGG